MESFAMRAMLLLLLLSWCVSCGPGKKTATDTHPTSPFEKLTETNLISHRRDDVRFFERPSTLAAARRSRLSTPLVVLLETNQWTEVIGADSPTFALYADGTIIQNTSAGFTTTHITGQEIDELLKQLNPSALSQFYGGFTLEGISDQRNQNLLIYQNGEPIFISVDGPMENSGFTSRLPKAVVAAFSTLRNFRHTPARPWLPEDIEVMIGPYEYAPEPSIIWPKNWPDLSASRAIARGDSFSIFMPSAKLAEVQAFIARRRKKGAIEIGGRKWTASLRFPFPQEQLWMASNLELKETKH